MGLLPHLHDVYHSYLSLLGYKRAQKIMEGFWQRVAERDKDANPYRAGYAQIVVVADNDQEAERLYGPHIDYFFNRCLHVYPGFADAPAIAPRPRCAPALCRRLAGPRVRCALSSPGRILSSMAL